MVEEEDSVVEEAGGLDFGDGLHLGLISVGVEGVSRGAATS